MMVDVLGTPEHGLQHEWVADAFQQLFGDARFADVTSVHAAELVRRGLLEIARREIAVLSDDFSLGSFDGLFVRSGRVSMAFGQVAEEYLADEIERARINRRKEQWVDKVRAHVAFVIEFFGADTPIDQIDHDASKRFLSTLAQIPANREKRFPGLSIEQAVLRGTQEGKSRLAPNSQSRYLDFFKGIMALATAKRLVPSNPVLSLRPLMQDTLSASDKRRPFSVEQVIAILTSNFYDHWRAGGTSYQKPDRDWRFWLPLLLAFAGMRPGEACQLVVSDIRQSKSGVWYAHVEPTDHDADEINAKSVKTAQSRRNFPIHQELITVGFLRFVTLRSKDGETARLFPNLKRGPKGYFSDYPCRRFREVFLSQATELQPRQTIYSFRHSFRDALRRANAPNDVLSALGGWSEGTKVSDNYGDKSDPDYLVKFVAQVGYPGLVLEPNRRRSAATAFMASLRN